MSTFLLKRNNAPDPIGRNADILEYIKTVRVPVYNKTRLATREAEQNPKPSEQAKQERERRLEERKILAQLSRYYLLGSDEDEDAGDDGLEEVWERPPLLREGKLGPDRLPFERHSTHLYSSQC